MGLYYHDRYWITKGLLGEIKNFVYSLFQVRRKKWVSSILPSGNVLDVGSGEGNFAKLLKNKYKVTNLDASFSELENPSVIRKDFTKWKTNKKFDAVVFWESLEHVESSREYLKKANKILKYGGHIFIECPQYNSIEAKLFGKYWFHLDLPRHLSHLTKKGLFNLLTDQNFKVIRFQNVFAPEYVVWGCIASFLSLFSINITDSVKKGNFLIFFLVLPLTIISLITEIIFLFLYNSPIMLVVAQKRYEA